MELRQAVLELDSNRVRDLVGTNIDVNYADPSDKCTALHFAASFGDTEMIQFLLSRPDIIVDIQNMEGNSPLHVSSARANLPATLLLLQAGANPFLRNAKDKRPIDYSGSGEIRTVLANQMIASPDSSAQIISEQEKRDLAASLPKDYQGLLNYTIDVVVKHFQFQERVKESLLRLIEEKHIALHKYRLFEQALGFVDRDQSENFLNQLSFFQEENERQAADLVYYKSTVSILKSSAAKQEENYQRSIAEMNSEHNEQLQSLMSRAEESQRTFMEYQKSTMNDLNELSKLKSEVITLRTKLNLLESGDSHANEKINEKLQGELSSLNSQLNEVNAENILLKEKIKSLEKVPRLSIQDNSDAISIMSNSTITRIRRSIQDDMETMEALRQKQDDEDEMAGKVFFIKNDSEGPRQIKGGTREKLVERLTDGGTYDSQFLQAFLLTFRAFMKQETLLDLMIQRYQEASTSEVSNSFPTQPIQLRVCNTLKLWVDNYWFDFMEDENLYKKAFDFVCDVVNKESPKMSDQLKRLMERKRSGSDIVTVERKAKNQPKPVLPRIGIRKGSTFGLDTLTRDQRGVSILGIDRFYNVVSSKLAGNERIPEEGYTMRLTDLDPIEIARQCTLIEYEIFKTIKAPEFLNQGWMKEDKNKLAPGICEMTNWSNKITKWVISEIVSIHDSTRARAMLCEKFVLIAQHMEKLNNYNGVMEILAAFQSSAVHRLKKTTQSMGGRYLKILDELTKLTSRELNYKNLRSKVHAANPPLIPFPGVYLGDLVFLDGGNPMYINNDPNLINFQKFQKLASYILELQVYQQTPYNLEPVPEIQDLLKDLLTLDDDTAYNMSLICEPRNNRGTSTFLK